jgi:hypothetical protein
VHVDKEAIMKHVVLLLVVEEGQLVDPATLRFVGEIVVMPGASG